MNTLRNNASILPIAFHLLLIVAAGPAAISAAEPFALWTGERFPPREKIPFAPQIEHQTVHRAKQGEYQFLHGAAIIHFDGALYASWANSPVDENSKLEVQRGRRSTDGGRTWSDVELIAPGVEKEQGRSHGCFAILDGRLWTFAARFGGIRVEGETRFPGLVTDAFVLDPKTGRWTPQGTVMEDCWPYHEPLPLADGNWITAGQDSKGLPVAAISHGRDFTRWDEIKIPYDPRLEPRFAETALLVDGKQVTAVIRGSRNVAWVAESDDAGRRWSTARASNFPMPEAKAYVGRLSTGEPYLISNYVDRNTLLLALGRQGERSLRRVWKLRDGPSTPPRYAGFAKAKQWSYPYAYEHDGKLYVIYSVGKEDCDLTIVPLAALREELATAEE